MIYKLDVTTCNIVTGPYKKFTTGEEVVTGYKDAAIAVWSVMTINVIS